MKQDLVLEAGEEICWEGKPAPRCYTFRHWRHSIFGFVFLGICSYWQFLGSSVAEEYEVPWLVWVPMPFVLLGIYFSVGHLIQSRLEWAHVYYAITDRRLLAQRGILRLKTDSLELKEITYFSLHRQGEELGTLRVHKGDEKKLVLHCLEHPRRATDLLEKALKAGQTQVEAPAAQVGEDQAAGKAE